MYPETDVDVLSVLSAISLYSNHAAPRFIRSVPARVRWEKREGRSGAMDAREFALRVGMLLERPPRRAPDHALNSL